MKKSSVFVFCAGLLFATMTSAAPTFAGGHHWHGGYYHHYGWYGSRYYGWYGPYYGGYERQQYNHNAQALLPLGYYVPPEQQAASNSSRLHS